MSLSNSRPGRAGDGRAFLRRELDIRSIADFGCTLGTWFAVWRAAGVAGVDGAYVGRRRLAIPESGLYARDLARPIDLGRQFDLVPSLEVAEHLPERAARGFVETLTCHGDLVLLSGQPPGQGASITSTTSLTTIGVCASPRRAIC